MNSRYIKALIILILIVLLYQIFRHFSYQQDKPIESIYVVDKAGDSTEKVKVAVYYEALCPDSKYFIDRQLLPTYEKLKNQLIVDLVPYGKAQTIINQDGDPDFDCQHGPAECFANKIHACVIKHVTDEYVRLKYIACMISNNQNAEKAGRRCGQEANLNFEPILQCAKEPEGSTLLKHYGERTNSLNPVASFIPTIELNESQRAPSQAAILKDLFGSVCGVFKDRPEKC